MAGRTLTYRVRVDGVRDALSFLRTLPSRIQDAVAEASDWIAEDLADSVRRASTIDAQSAAVGKTVKAVRGQVPTVQVGGSQRVTSRGVPAWRLLFGSEFGMTRRSGWFGNPRYGQSEGRQFAPHQGTTGRWFFPTADREVPEAIERWQQAIDDECQGWGQ